jgi:hypothetical protein
LQDSLVSKGDEESQTNFQKAIELYQPTYRHHLEHKRLLDVSAMVLANLCVAYIMDEKNHEAEEIMKQVEMEEEQKSQAAPGKQVGVAIQPWVCVGLNHTIKLISFPCRHCIHASSIWLLEHSIVRSRTTSLGFRES